MQREAAADVLDREADIDQGNLEFGGSDDGHFAAFERQFDLRVETRKANITFLGCSPYLKTQPESPEDEDYCAIIIPRKTSIPELLINTQGYAQKYSLPRCPYCKKQAADNFTLDNTNEIKCMHCHETVPVAELDWKKLGGIVNFRIEVTKIFPNEAIPTEQLLARLNSFRSIVF